MQWFEDLSCFFAELPENWTDTRETLLEGMLFNLKYLGMTLVEQPKGEELSAAAVKRIVATVSPAGTRGGEPYPEASHFPGAACPLSPNYARLSSPRVCWSCTSAHEGACGTDNRHGMRLHVNEAEASCGPPVWSAPGGLGPMLDRPAGSSDPCLPPG